MLSECWNQLKKVVYLSIFLWYNSRSVCPNILFFVLSLYIHVTVLTCNIECFDALCWFYQDCRILAITIWYLFLTIFSKNLCLLFHDFTVFYIPMTNHIHFCNLKDDNIRNFRRPFSVFLMIREIPCAYQTSSLYKSIEQMYSYKLIISLSNSSSYFTDFDLHLAYTC